MRISIVVPPNVKIFWLKATAKNLSTKHRDVVVVGPVEDRMELQLRRFGVVMINRAIFARHKPTTWWGKVKHWFETPINDEPEVDTVMIIMDHSAVAMDAIAKAKAHNQKMWIVNTF